MKEKQYVAFGKYRLSQETNYPNNWHYYRLYEKHIDDFGNESWSQIWSGSETSKAEDDEYAAIMADALYFRLSTNQ